MYYEVGSLVKVRPRKFEVDTEVFIESKNV